MIYELMYIVPSNYSETEIDGIVDNASAIFTKAEAKIEKTENLGKIKFAYPINRVRHGTYILNYIEVEGEEALKQIDTELKHSEEILRHIIIKRPEGIPSHKVQLVSYQEPLTPEGKRVAQQKREQHVQKPSAPLEEKISVAELDKKLDEILDTDITENV